VGRASSSRTTSMRSLRMRRMRACASSTSIAGVQGPTRFGHLPTPSHVRKALERLPVAEEAGFAQLGAMHLNRGSSNVPRIAHRTPWRSGGSHAR
jgi:hypothetical protein